MSHHSVEQTTEATAAGPLDVRLSVDADTTGGCPLGERDVGDVKQSLTRAGLGDTATCQVAIEGRDVSDYRRTPVGDACPCAVFENHECISEVEAVADGSLVFSLVVPDRGVLRDVVADLRALGISVSLDRVRSGVDGDDASSGVALTEKQREALALAIESGYYDDPRNATLSDLADELAVTPSAVSQRLNAVERKLVSERASELAEL